ncbi:MAG: 50S ribosomal protein L25 [Planctomycetota bacterium]
MEITSIRGETRTPGNRHANIRLRKRGMVPAIIYGHQETPETVALSRHDLELALERVKHVIRLEIEGQQTQYLIKDVQYDHLQKLPIHVDLMRVDLNERVHIKLALELHGEPKGTHEGGELVQVVTDLDIECPLLNIPESLPHNVKDLELGQALHAKDLSLPPDVKCLLDPDEIIAVVKPKRGVQVEEAAEEEATAAEGGVGPEVISKGKGEDADGA